MKPFAKGIIMLASLALLAGCSSTSKIESDLGIKGAPDWVNEGTQAVKNKNGRYIYGIGMAPPLGDQSLQTNTADSRARAEVARVVSSYVDAALSDYTASTGDSNTMSIEQTINSSTQAMLTGSKIKGRWRDKETGNIWSFAEMDMTALDDAVATADKLSASFKEYYSDSSATNFERFTEGDE